MRIWSKVDWIKEMLSKIEKVPRSIQDEKSAIIASSNNLVSTIGEQASPKNGGRN